MVELRVNASDYFGYQGKVLQVDLSTKNIAISPPPEEILHHYIGGMGFGIKVLYDRVGPEVDPFGAENIIIIATGPLTGTIAPCSARTEVITKSPLNGALASTNFGGFWGPMLKYAGYDAVIISGRSEKWVYIFIDDDHVEIRDAEELKGKDTWETKEWIAQNTKERYRNEIQVISIGPAGENLVRYAAITANYFNSASRGGAGAIMGSKRLKAIAVRGRGKIRIAKPAEFFAAVAEANERIKSDIRFPKVCLPGPLGNTDRHVKTGSFPGKNFQTGSLEDWIETRGSSVALKYLADSPNPRNSGIGCHCCPMACYRWVEIPSGPYKGLKLGGLFATFIYDFGAECGIKSLPAIWKCEELTQRLGLDCSSAAGAIAFAMELYQRGILSKEEVDGLEFEWGNESAVIELLNRIARREGLGDLLAEGSDIASKKIGRGSESYVMSIKGSEIMSTDPRTYPNKAWVLGHQTNPRGGDNIKTTHTILFFLDEYQGLKQKLGDEDFFRWFVDGLDMFDETKRQCFGFPPRIEPDSSRKAIPLTQWHEDLVSMMNALGICIMDQVLLSQKLGPTYYSKMLSACTGIERSPEDLMAIGSRIFNLQRIYIAIHGMNREDDHWPQRFYEERLTDGPSKGKGLEKEEMDKMLDEYYELRGWDKQTGIPTPQTLRKLGLEYILDNEIYQGLSGKNLQQEEA